MALRVLDLFSGIGGFSLGLERAGMKTVAFCEIDPYCRAVLRKHWPGVPCHEDITDLEFSAGEADVVTGGFPCQDISLAGPGAGIAGSRSGLWRELLRAVRVVRPFYAAVENVAALLGRGMGRVLGDLAEIRYDAEWHCIPAGRLGAPHIRDRVIILAYADTRRGRADSSGGDDPDGNDAGRAKTDCLLGALPQPDSEWHLGGAFPSHTDGKRRRQHYRAQVSVPPEITGLAGPVSHDGWKTPWPRFLADLCRVDDGVRGGLDKAAFERLGNAVVPQIPEIIGRAIIAAHAKA